MPDPIIPDIPKTPEIAVVEKPVIENKLPGPNELEMGKNLESLGEVSKIEPPEKGFEAILAENKWGGASGSWGEPETPIGKSENIQETVKPAGKPKVDGEEETGNKYKHIVEKDDTVWNIIRKNLGSKPEGMTAQDWRAKIDSYKDQFSSMSPDQLKTIGIESGDINKIKPGEMIDLSSVMKINRGNVKNADQDIHAAGAENTGLDRKIKPEDIKNTVGAVEQESGKSPEKAESPLFNFFPYHRSGNFEIAQPSSELRGAVRKVFGSNAERAAVVMGTENPQYEVNAHHHNKNGSVDTGLFQINSNTLADFLKRKPNSLKEIGVDSIEDLRDPLKNIQLAKLIFDEQGWDAWHAPKKKGYEI